MILVPPLINIYYKLADYTTSIKVHFLEAKEDKKKETIKNLETRCPFLMIVDLKIGHNKCFLCINNF